MIATAGLRRAAGAVLAVAVAAAPAVGQELSEKSVRTFMEYAWSLVPAKFTKGADIMAARVVLTFMLPSPGLRWFDLDGS